MGVPSLVGLACNDRSPTDRANGVASGTITAVGPGKAFSLWGPLNFVAYGVLAQALTVATAGTNSATVNSSTNLNIGDSVQSTLVPPGTTVLTSGAGALTFAFPTYTMGGYISNTGPGPTSTIQMYYPSGFTLGWLVGATVQTPGTAYFPASTTVISATSNQAPAAGQVGIATLVVSKQPTSVPANGFGSMNGVADPIPVEFSLAANCIAAGTDSAATFSGGTTPIAATFQIERSFDGGSTWIICNAGGLGTPAKFTSPANPISLSFGDPEAAMLYRVNTTAYTGTSNVTINYRFSTTGQASTVLSVPALM